MSGGLTRELREAARFAADAVNAYMRGLSVPTVALQYRYEPITALVVLQSLCRMYGPANVERSIPPQVFWIVVIEEGN